MIYSWGISPLGRIFKNHREKWKKIKRQNVHSKEHGGINFNLMNDVVTFVD